MSRINEKLGLKPCPCGKPWPSSVNPQIEAFVEQQVAALGEFLDVTVVGGWHAAMVVGWIDQREHTDRVWRVSRRCIAYHGITGQQLLSGRSGFEEITRPVCAGDRDRDGARETPPGRLGDRSRGERDGVGAATADTNSQVDDALYQAIKARLIAEAPALLRVILEAPELEVRVERRVLTAEGSSTTGRLARLIHADFLAESRRFSEILRELERTGTRVNNKSLSVALKELVVAGFLTKESVDRYRAVPEMKVHVVEAA